MNLQENIEYFVKYTGLFVQPVNYDTVCSFLGGYNFATGGGLFVGFHEWLVPRVGHGNNLVWTALVESLAFPDAEDPEAERKAADPQVMVNFLFDILRQFFKDRDSSQGLREIYLRYDRWLRSQSWYGPDSPAWISIED